MGNSKNTIAILAAVVAVASWAAAVYWHGAPVAVLAGSIATIATFLYGLAPGPRRAALVIMTIAAGSGVLFFYFDTFWGLVVAGLVFLWAAFGLLPWMDAVWRAKLGFVAAVFAGALVVLWPTLHNM
jgi:hypothetical protein